MLDELLLLMLGGVDPVLFTFDGTEQILPDGIKMIKPNGDGCIISSLKKTGDDVTNYASTFATTDLVGDKYTPIICGGTGKHWDKITGTVGGTCWVYKVDKTL